MGRNVYYTTSEFVEKAQAIHGSKYDYSKVEYIDSKTKVCIICSTHGEFWQIPAEHLQGKGCGKCANNVRLTTESFINKAHKIHGDKYDYSKVEYVSTHQKVIIICPIHGEFYQAPSKHLQGKGCLLCYNDRRSILQRKTCEDFVRDAKKVHGERYDYSKVNYVNGTTKICIICPTHGEFWMTPQDHLQKNGCKLCHISRLEESISKFLQLNNIEYEEEKTFDWLKYKRNLYLDFYLPQYNVAIECQGKQHFIDEGFGDFELNVTRDKIKKQLCDEHGIKVLYFSNLKIEYPYEVYTDEKKLLEEITSGNLGIKK